MNFLVCKNPVLIDLYWAPLLENGESQLLGDFAELLWRAASAKEGLALIDTQIPGFSGMAEVAHLKRTNRNIRILLLSDTMKAEEELTALAAGAAGSCGPDLAPEKIRQILTTVNNGGVWISSAALPQLLQRLKRWENTTQQKNDSKADRDYDERIVELTPREREIVNLIAKGESNKLIARDLNITDRTVKTHLSIIFQKLKVNDRLQLALFANRRSTR